MERLPAVVSVRLYRLRFCLFFVGTLAGGLLARPAWGQLPPPNLTFEAVGLDDVFFREYFSRIGQDTTGFLWFGTEYGLLRYDGYEFSSFHHDDAPDAAAAPSRTPAAAAPRCLRSWRARC